MQMQTARFFGALAGLLGAAAHATPAIHEIATTQRLVPGFPGQNRFARFEGASISSAGTVLFRAVVAGPDIGVDGNDTLWLWSGGQLSLVLREGDSARIGNSFIPIAATALASFNGRDDVVLLSGLNADPTRTAVLTPVTLSESTRVGASIAAEQTPVPGLNYTDPLDGIGAPVLNDAGAVAFAGHRRLGIWSTRTGALERVAAVGDRANGTGGAAFLAFDDPAQNGTGTLAFRAMITPESGSAEPRWGVWTLDTSGTQRQVFTTEGAHGVPDAVFRCIGREPRINSAGQVAFFGMTGGGSTPDNDSGIWSTREGSLRKVFLEYDWAPGTGVQFEEIRRDFAFNDAGTVAFVAELRMGDRSRNSGLWISPSRGPTRLVAREGNVLPGATGDTRMHVFGRFMLNNANQAVLLVRLRGTDATRATSDALVFVHADGSLETIVRAGDPFGVDGGATRIVRTIELSDSPINDRGTVVFSLGFNDGTSGVFAVTPGCVADVATDGVAHDDPRYEQPDGQVTDTDLEVFTAWWDVDDPRADLTTPDTRAGDPGYGAPDGDVTAADLNFFLNVWTGGCQ